MDVTLSVVFHNGISVQNDLDDVFNPDYQVEVVVDGKEITVFEADRKT